MEPEENKDYKNVPSTPELLRAARYSQAQSEKLGMKWFKFTVYFRLLVGSLIGFFNFLSQYTYESKLNGYFHTFTEYCTVYSVFFVIFYLFGIAAFLNIHNFKKKGLRQYFIVQYGFRLVVCAIDLSYGLYPQTIANLFTAVIFFIPEFIYFKKRRHLFDNENKSINLSTPNKHNLKEALGKVKGIKRRHFLIFLSVIYLVSAVIHSVYFMPFYLVEVHKEDPKKSAATKEVIAEGYAPITEINYSYRFDSKKDDGDKYKTANYPKLFTRLSVEFLVFAIIYLLTYKKCSASNIGRENIKKEKLLYGGVEINPDTIIKYYRRKVAELSAENKEYSEKQKAYGEFLTFLSDCNKINSNDYKILQEMLGISKKEEK